MDPFLEEVEEEEVHVRDKWQFELKSEFFPQGEKNQIIYGQEFYLFIPNALQINSYSYNKEQFYEDQTNLIRYKTPIFTFEEIIDLSNPPSPLSLLFNYVKTPPTSETHHKVIEELKMLANIFKSTLRTSVKKIMSKKNVEELHHLILNLCEQIGKFQKEYARLSFCYQDLWKDLEIDKFFFNIKEFISQTIQSYLTGLLENLRLRPIEGMKECDKALCHVLIQEKKEFEFCERRRPIANEKVLYHKSLLNKFVIGVLLLNINRFSLDEQYRVWISSIAAGVAMLIYFSLFVFLGSVFVINSEPFILFTVVIYVLKDRIKEGIKSLSYQEAFKWFPDFTTHIQSPDQTHNLGVLKESFSFLKPRQLPEEIRSTRERKFHAVLESFERPESIIFYKRTVKMHTPKNLQPRCHGLNILFRFNIHKFLLKASDPYETYASLDSKTLKIYHVQLPKVYHLNLIIRNTSLSEMGLVTTEIKLLRIILDKNGIKRIEQIS